MAKRVFLNCRVYTLSSDNQVAEAIVVEDGVIAFVGAGEDAAAFAGEGAELVDLGGRTVLPGFTDAHCHLGGFGVSAHMCADLNGTSSIGEIIARLKVSARPGKWILGTGFDQERLLECRYPTRHDLDGLSETDPIAIFRVCGHSCVVNSRALEMVGAAGAGDGAEHGILAEHEAARVLECIPDPEIEDVCGTLLQNAERAVSRGVTSVHSVVMGSVEELAALRLLRESGRLPVRVYAMMPFDCWRELADEGLCSGSGDDWLKIGALKLFADGSLGARTAALKEPYADDSANSGRLLMDAREQAEELLNAHRAGFQFAFHAIGDRAVQEAIDAIALVRELGAVGIRHRIEHASLLDAELLRRLVEMEITACVQPQFVVSDFWAIDRVGARRVHWYHPFAAMLEAGVRMCIGSDFPVEPIDPLQAIHRAVNRDVHTPEERITVEQAVRAYCVGGAYAAGEESRKGKVESGKLADLVVLSDDVFHMRPEAIESVRVEMTIVDGHIAYEAPGNSAPSK